MFKGDDYQVLFTASKKNRKLIKNISRTMNQKITIIGKINNKFKNNSILLDNKPINLSNLKVIYISFNKLNIAFYCFFCIVRILKTK